MRKREWLIPLLPVFLVLAVLLSSCGDDSNPLGPGGDDLDTLPPPDTLIFLQQGSGWNYLYRYRLHEWTTQAERYVNHFGRMQLRVAQSDLAAGTVRLESMFLVDSISYQYNDALFPANDTSFTLRRGINLDAPYSDSLIIHELARQGDTLYYKVGSQRTYMMPVEYDRNTQLNLRMFIYPVLTFTNFGLDASLTVDEGVVEFREGFLPGTYQNFTAVFTQQALGLSRMDAIWGEGNVSGYEERISYDLSAYLPPGQAGPLGQ